MKDLLNHQGLSLLEATISIGILSLISTHLLGINHNANEMMTKIELRNTSITLMNEISSVLNDSANCMNTFGGQAFNNRGLINSDTIYEGPNKYMSEGDKVLDIEFTKTFLKDTKPSTINDTKLIEYHAHFKRGNQKQIRKVKASVTVDNRNKILDCHVLENGLTKTVEIEGYEIVTNSINNNGHYDVDVKCPVGKVPIGGGCTQDTSTFTALTANGPTIDGWHCRSRDIDTPQTRTTTAHAICITKSN